MRYKSVIYISHPYQGNETNKEIVGELVRQLQKKFPEYLFISPIHAFSFCYHTTNYEDGLNMCLWMLNKCDAAWVFGDWKNSIGCQTEVDYCKNHHIYYQIMNDNCLQIKGTPRNCAYCELVEFDETWIQCDKAQVQKIYLDIVSKYEGENVNARN